MNLVHGALSQVRARNSHNKVNLKVRTPISLISLAVGLGLSAAAAAQTSPPPAAPEAKGDWSGYAGLGAIGYSRYAGGKGERAVPAPTLEFDYKGIVYVDVLRAGARFWASDDKKMALGVAGEPRFGYTSTDGSRLTGMARRNLSINLGPSFEWSTPIVDVSVVYLTDVTGSSKGGDFNALLFKQLADTQHWDIGVYTGLERLDSRVTNYYFGVRPEEATLARPFYQPGAVTNWTTGLMGAYRINARYALMFGVQNTELGGAAANSPIVETRSAKLAYVGFGWRL